MTELEFEQKYLLDQRQTNEIDRILKSRSDLKVVGIRQFYNGSENRYRSKYDFETRQDTVTKEKKTKIKIDAPYTVSLEDDPEPVSLDEFNRKFDASKRRLTKIRYIVNGTPIGHKVMVDFFLRPDKRVLMEPDNCYAIMAEVETVLDGDTKTLYLDLALPIYLEPFLLKMIDSRDSSAKDFKSANMTEDRIGDLEQALAKLYGST